MGRGMLGFARVVHSIVPLAVLEAVRNLDTPVEDGLSEFAEELLSKRLGLSNTVAMQLTQYEAMVRRDAGADAAHVEALLRLVGRRPDADLVFADAGRRAARRAVRRLFVGSRLVARAAPRLLGYGVARRAARAVFGGELRRENGVAVAHRIELQPLADFPGEVRPYGSWRELHAELQALARGRTLAMEVSPQDAVPYLDRVPHGVVQLLEGFGARIVSSAPLVTRFAARWSAGEADGHRRAAQALAEIAPEALAWAGRETARGAEVREAGLQRRVVEAIERAGLVADHPPIAAFGPNSAMPHYEPRAGADRRLEAGQVVLLDLWGGPTLGSVFADQTWMGFSGRAPDAEVRKVWQTVMGARDAAVALLRESWKRPGKGEGGRVLTGAEVDDAARSVIRGAGYGEYFVHRTGHSIDRDLHGSGPHIDNFETADERPLVAGVGFSIEPGIYLPGRFGMRSEINVFMSETGPEVTPPAPQAVLLLV